MADTPNMLAWKRRRAKYLLSVNRLEQIRAEKLERFLDFKPGEIEEKLKYKTRRQLAKKTQI
jgi:hypothetical protein